MMILEITNADRMPGFLEKVPGDPKNTLIEKIKKIEQEMLDQFAILESHLFKRSWEENKRSYHHLKQLKKNLDNLIELYVLPTPGDTNPPKEEIEVGHLTQILDTCKNAINYLGGTQRWKKVLNGSLFRATSTEDKFTVYLFMNDKGTFRKYMIRDDEGVIPDFEKLMLDHMATYNQKRLPDVFANLSVTPGWHPLKLSGLPDGISFHVIFSIENFIKLILRKEFAIVESYSKDLPGYRRINYLKCALKQIPQNLLAEIFLQVHLEYPELARAVYFCLDFSDPKTRQPALRLALDSPYTPDLKHIMKKCPDLLPENPKATDVIPFAYYGLVKQVKSLLDSGFPASNAITQFMEGCSPIQKTTQEAVVQGFAADNLLPQSDHFATTKLLVDKGLNLNRLVFIGSEMYYPLEYVVFNLSRFSKASQVIRFLLECCAKPTQNIYRHWLPRAHLKEFQPYVQYLKQFGFISEEVIAAVTKPRVDNKEMTVADFDLLMQYSQYLQTMKTVSHLNQNILDLNKIADIHQFKKKIKPKLKSNYRYGALYAAFVKDYDALVQQNILLSNLRAISQELRKQVKLEANRRDFAHRTVSFYSTWNFDTNLREGKKRIENLMPSQYPAIINISYQRVLDAIERLKANKYLNKRWLVALHGTKSSSLPSLLRTKQILSMGDLLKQDLIPFSGETCGSDRDSDHGVNKENISCERLSRKWDDGKGSLYYEAPTRVMMARHYAVNMYNEIGMLEFKPEQSQETLSVHYLKGILNNTNLYRRHGLFVRLYFDILRLRVIGVDISSQTSKLKAFCEERLKMITNNDDIDDLKLILKAIKCPLTTVHEDEDLKMMMDPNPYGIVFGSTSVYAKPYTGGKDIDPYEYTVPSPLTLGKDIQVAFTDSHHVEELSKKLSPLGIRVFDYDLAMAQEFVNMVTNTECESVVGDQLKLAHELQIKILPVYASLYPDQDPKPILEGKTVARPIHGPMHACRAAIWALALHRRRERENNIKPSSCYQLQKAVACHDIRRKHEKYDPKEKKNADYYRGMRVSSYQPEDRLAELTHHLEFKDPKDGIFADDDHRDLHDADVLEIRRCIEEKEFRVSELCTNDARLTAEVFRFIELTESPQLHLYLETSVPNYYAELMRLLHHTKLPYLNDLLAVYIQAFTTQPVDPEVLQLISAH